MDGTSNTPRYVLNDAAYPICPSMTETSLQDHSVVIYGFSDKARYDIYLKASSLALTPYPLVKRFLEKHVDQNADEVQLVVIDPESPTQTPVHAATFQNVLEAMRLGSKTVNLSHKLIFDSKTSKYQAEAISFSASAEPLA
ncbi:hypothetical protein RBSH_02698 [Rhodopirellula baltica SH28]|uniref:Uncharacterized protein n=1 Tax=Rhodopirellula baltica SH28 TaxID=993517 RepID=K5CE32_RHOBT|nr:hypothetical protein [Rhodopirellula baltica]EKK02000.1 hypothetical protein RBSH_02698 [Rhodopirellula baltica SH28]